MITPLAEMYYWQITHKGEKIADSSPFPIHHIRASWVEEERTHLMTRDNHNPWDIKVELKKL